MDPYLSQWLEAIFRWIHVVAGVLWIGLLYFFNWVNGPFAKTLEADCKKKVVPELMPRALYFFRWGAAYTWVSGLLLLGFVYYMGGLMGPDDTAPKALIICLLAMFVGAIVYDVLWKMIKAQAVALAVSFLLLVGLIAALSYYWDIPERAVFMHVGALFGTATRLQAPLPGCSL